MKDEGEGGFFGLFDDHLGEGEEGGLEVDEEADEGGEGEAVEEDGAEDVAFFAVGTGGGAGDDDALGVDHFAHDAA